MKNTRLLSGLKGRWVSERKMAGLYAGIFFQAFLYGTWFIAIPFIVNRFSGSDSDVGVCTGTFFAGYITALTVFLLHRNVFDKYNPKRLVQIAIGIDVVLMASAYLIVATPVMGYSGYRIIFTLKIISAILGFVSVMLWPQIIGWLSAGHEGFRLNHKLGIFNISCSLAGLISPYIAGYLVQLSSVLPLITCTAMAVISFVIICFTRKPPSSSEITNDDIQQIDTKQAESLQLCFVWLSRIAMITSFACVGLIRVQMPLLFKLNLGFSESKYGTAIMVMGTLIFLVFWVAGKTHKWHYKLPLLLLSQASLLLSMLIILNASNLWHFFTATGLVGISQAFSYSSHLYYSLSGSKERANKMALHEIILATGLLFGSVAGGYWGDYFGRYIPYWCGFGFVAIGLLVQSVVWFSFVPARKKTA